MNIKHALAGILALGAVISFQPKEAQAANSDYCREYTRTVSIGGRLQEAYGTACLQNDGSWMIVGEGLGNDIPDNVNNVEYVIHDNRREIVPTRVVYYDRSPVIYRSRPVTPVFVWTHNGYYRGGNYVAYRNNNYRDYGWNDHGRGRGGQGRDRDDDWDHRGGRGNGWNR